MYEVMNIRWPDLDVTAFGTVRSFITSIVSLHFSLPVVRQNRRRRRRRRHRCDHRIRSSSVIAITHALAHSSVRR